MLVEYRCVISRQNECLEDYLQDLMQTDLSLVSITPTKKYDTGAIYEWLIVVDDHN